MAGAERGAFDEWEVTALGGDKRFLHSSIIHSSVCRESKVIGVFFSTFSAK